MDKRAAKPERLFQTTHWSVVVALRDPDPARARQALERLCSSYWYPLYVFVRRHEYPPDQAEDVVQGFFAHLLEHEVLKKADQAKGRFRSFLLTCLRHYMVSLREQARRQKRGGGQPFLPLDTGKAEERYGLEPTVVEDPEKAFDRHWALAVVETVFERLRAESAACGRGRLFAHLKGAVAGDEPKMNYAQLARRTGLSESGVRSAVFRLRAQYRRVFREEVAQMVDGPEEVDAEIQHLFRALSG